MKETLNRIKAEALEAIASPETDDAALEALRIKYLGKKGELTAVLRGMGQLSAEERPVVGQIANEVRAEIEAAITEKKTVLKENCRFSLYGNRLQADDMTFFFDDVSVMTVLGKNKLNIYHKDGLYQVKGDSRFNALKYVNFYYRYKNISRGNEDGKFLGL